MNEDKAISILVFIVKLAVLAILVFVTYELISSYSEIPGITPYVDRVGKDIQENGMDKENDTEITYDNDRDFSTVIYKEKDFEIQIQGTVELCSINKFDLGACLVYFKESHSISIFDLLTGEIIDILSTEEFDHVSEVVDLRWENSTLEIYYYSKGEKLKSELDF